MQTALPFPKSETGSLLLLTIPGPPDNWEENLDKVKLGGLNYRHVASITKT